MPDSSPTSWGTAVAMWSLAIAKVPPEQPSSDLPVGSEAEAMTRHPASRRSAMALARSFLSKWVSVTRMTLQAAKDAKRRN